MIPEVADGADGVRRGRADRRLRWTRRSAACSCPRPSRRPCFAWFQAANVGTSAYPFLTMAQRQPAARPRQPRADRHLRARRWSRAAGSARCACPSRRPARRWPTSPPAPSPRTTARYRLSGNKMWISGGDHELTENIVHLVLARIPGGPAGREGHLAVHRARSSWRRRRLARRAQRRRAGRAQPQDGLPRHDEHPAQLRRGQAHARRCAPARSGYLVGEPHRGLAYMFHMMNEARIGVGRGRGGARLHRLPARPGLRPHRARRAARRRRRTRLPRCRSSSTPTSRRMLLAQKAYVEGAAGAGPVLRPAARRGAHGAEARRTGRAPTCCSTCSPRSRRAGPRSGAWRPTTSPSRCTAATATPASTRSSSSTATTGSTRSTRARTASRRSTCSAARSSCGGGAGLRCCSPETIHATVARARAAACTEQAGCAWTRPPTGVAGGHRARCGRRRPGRRAGQRHGLPGGRRARRASPGCGWSRCSPPATAAGDFYEGKRAAARYFFRYELPRTGPQFDLLESLDRTTLDVDPACL